MMRADKRLLVASCLVLVLVLVYIQKNHGFGRDDIQDCRSSTSHPVDGLIKASEQWEAQLRKAETSLQASAEYRQRRGRHPPPGFDAWFSHAKASGAVIVEEFFDQIYKDLEPFWGVEPTELRASVAAFPDVVAIRNGRVQDVPNKFIRTKVWVEMMSKIDSLPDMDLAINRLDEARVLAPREALNAALERARVQKAKMMQQPHTDFSETTILKRAVPKNIHWSADRHELRSAVLRTCPEDLVEYVSASGFIANVTAAKDTCRHLNLHGGLIEPATVDFTTSLIPVFTGSKLPIYQDIIIPEPSYYSDEPSFTGKSYGIDWSTYYSWKSKINGLVWRGGSTGGAVHDSNWEFFHRQRLVVRLNASEHETVRMPGTRPTDPHFTKWLASVSNVAFTRLFCGDQDNVESCPSMASHFTIAKPIKMASQYRWKYLPDTDGNSISERFRAFLLSNSAPIRASILDDWQDHRLVAWKHYIPMHLDYTEIYGLMGYFLGYDNDCAHDSQGEKIAQDGRQWAQKVLRREDMVIYLHRVLLEYARLMSDNRDRLGYVRDLV